MNVFAYLPSKVSDHENEMKGREFSLFGNNLPSDTIHVLEYSGLNVWRIHLTYLSQYKIDI